MDKPVPFEVTLLGCAVVFVPLAIALIRAAWRACARFLIGREILQLRRLRLMLLTARRMERNHAREARNAQAETNSGGCTA
jgi:hypothetical protein